MPFLKSKRTRWLERIPCNDAARDDVFNDRNARLQTDDVLLFLLEVWCGTGPKGLEIAATFIGADSQVITILDPFLF